MLTRRTTLGLLAATPALIVARPALADAPWYYAEGGIALGGTDPVAYFTDAAPTPGKAEHSLMWQGATWRFASAANMGTFEADPMAYAPQYGGYCAYAVSKGATAPTDPAAWTVYEGKLYLNFSVQVRGIWSEDIPGNIARADANWPAVLSA